MCVVVAVPVISVAEPVDWSGSAAGFSKSKCVFWQKANVCFGKSKCVLWWQYL